jgi:hypothetical protein
MAAAARIGVVAFQVAAGDAVGESGKLRQRPVRRADHRCAIRDLRAHRHRACDARGLIVERGNGATDGVDDPPLAIVHHLGGQIGIVEPHCEFGDAFRAVVHRGSRSLSIEVGDPSTIR